MMRLDPADLDDLLGYKLLTGVMVPRPIAFISTVSVEGLVNAAPFSWSTVAGMHPPLLTFAPCRAPDRVGFELDTLRNVKATGEFVWNVVTNEIERPMVNCSFDWTADVDEIRATGLTAVQSDLVAPPRIAESPISCECVVERIIRVGSGDCALTIGRVMRIHVDSRLLDGERVDCTGAGLVGRMGGTEYVRTDDSFTLPGLQAPGDDDMSVPRYVYE